MLNWADQFNICCLLDSNHYRSAYSSYDLLLGAGAANLFNVAEHGFDALPAFLANCNDWLLGHFDYDLKNELEPGLHSCNPDHTAFPRSLLFVPQVLMYAKNSRLTIGVLNQAPEAIWEQLQQERFVPAKAGSMQLAARIPKDVYLQRVAQLKAHIHKGDCYEINFCQEFYGTGRLHPASVYAALVQAAPNPFAAFYKIDRHYLMCASPERFIRKEGKRIVTQPIKGTASRHPHDDALDAETKYSLQNNLKERTENVMIVDLVRNDLSKVCTEGSVRATALYDVQAFPTVFQMTSTVEGELQPGVDLAATLKATFPMGSMTGAPKKRVMELAEQYEATSRGIYSGTVGYVTPGNDFDFNVVIRSLVYNDATGYTSYHVGSAITAASDPEAEYEECLLKGRALSELLGGESSRAIAAE